MLERCVRLLDHRHRVLRVDHGDGVAGESKSVRLGAAMVRDAVLSPATNFFRVLICIYVAKALHGNGRWDVALGAF